MRLVGEILTDIEAIIIAGGRGTRSLNPKLPKVLQILKPDLTLLDLHLQQLRESGIKKVSLLLGYQSETVIQHLLSNKTTTVGMEIDTIVEENPSGTLGSIVQSKICKPNVNYLVIYGDIAIVAPYDMIIKNWDTNRFEMAVVSHPNLHPEDSDRVVYDSGSRVTNIISKSINLLDIFPSTCMAGIFLINGNAILGISNDNQEKDITKDLLIPFSLRSKLQYINSSFYFKDTGTKDRLEAVQKDFIDGSAKKRGSRVRSAIFIDRDNTLIKDLVNGRKATDEMMIENSTANAIKKVNKAGVPIFLVSNQPAVAKGFIDYRDVLATQAKLENELRKNKAVIDDFRFCQHHPEKGHLGEVIELKINCKCRKPNVGMVNELSKIHNIRVAESILIGDSENDFNLAANSGMFFLRGNFGTGEVAKALLNALDRLLLSNDN